MSDYIKDPSLEDFIKNFNQQLVKNNEKNAKKVAELSDMNEPEVKRVLRGVYNDFFGTGSSEPSLFSPAAPTKKDTESPASLSSMEVTDLIQNLTNKLEADNLINRPEKPAAPAAEEGPATATADSEAKAEAPKEPEKSGMEQLKDLVGLKNIKHDVAELVALAKVRKMREEKGLKFVPTSLHLVFSGNPGTGKTTVARILAKLYKEIGILSKGQLVEVDRSGLVAGYVGQTAMKTQEKIQEAMGGILFIDEAYTLVRNEGNDFGQEAIDTILKAMEDHRDDFIVIVAGYTELMANFVESNPGLKSRFNKYMYFQDYTEEELAAIFRSNCKKYSYTLTEEAEAAVLKKIHERVENKDENFANAREIRNLFEEIITNQATRLAKLEAPTEEDLMTILPEDLEDNENYGWEEEEASEEAAPEEGASTETIAEEDAGSVAEEDANEGDIT